MRRVAIVNRPLDTAALQAEVSDPGAGAISVFVGTVRASNAGRDVSGIEYSAYPEMARRELDAIAAEVTSRFPGLRVVIEHRVGELVVGEASVVIAASHAHRGEALAATTRVIEELKRRVPIWKCEHYVDGTREWVHAASSAAPAATASGAVS